MLPTPSARRIARHAATCAASRPDPRFAPRGARIGGPARSTLAALTALCVATLLTACSMPRHPDAAAPPPDPFNPAATQLLDDTSWQLTSWTRADGAARDVPPGNDSGDGGNNDKAAGAPLTLTLSTASGQRRASGFSGCNRFTGTY